eukprot:m.90389 g.90389  ORF g.90389 m.90389 type:complete len:265 (+) comp26393_c0_seq1:354-1148(+)
MSTSSRREEQNSSCALFLAIMFVLMLFGNSNMNKAKTYDAGETSGHFPWHHTTPRPLLNISSLNRTYVGMYDPYPRINTTYNEIPPKLHNARASGVVILLFTSLMMLQLFGFCFVIAARRRQQRLLMQGDILPTSVHRSASGWGIEYESDTDDIDNHPAIASINNANADSEMEATNDVDVDLPSYEEALRCDPNLPDYHSLPKINTPNPNPGADTVNIPPPQLETSATVVVNTDPIVTINNADDDDDFSDDDNDNDNEPLLARS